MPWGARNDWTDAEVAFMRAARRNNVSFAAIGEELGRSEHAAWNKWRRLGTTPTNRLGDAFHTLREIEPATDPNSTDSSTPKFANCELHLRLMAEAMRRGEHLPRKAAA